MKRIPLIALAILLPLPLTAADSELTLKVDGLACPFCVNGVEKQLRRFSGVDGLTTELKTGSVSFHWEGTNSLAAHSLSNAVRRAGFTLRESQVRAQGLVKKTGNSFLLHREQGDPITLGLPTGEAGGAIRRSILEATASRRRLAVTGRLTGTNALTVFRLESLTEKGSHK